MEKNPKDHIEEIRRVKFSIGGELNPLTEDLHQAVKNLSAELYTKDVHFLMELIQVFFFFSNFVCFFVHEFSEISYFDFFSILIVILGSFYFFAKFRL